MDIDLIKEQICDVCHKTWQLGWVAANDGNVSAKLEGTVPSCAPPGMTKASSPRKNFSVSTTRGTSWKAWKDCVLPAR